MGSGNNYRKQCKVVNLAGKSGRNKKRLNTSCSAVKSSISRNNQNEIFPEFNADKKIAFTADQDLLDPVKIKCSRKLGVCHFSGDADRQHIRTRFQFPCLFRIHNDILTVPVESRI